MANYPSSIWSPSAIVDTTVLESVLITEAYDELDAVEQELGLNVHGVSGSLADRLNLFMDSAGETPYCRIVNADTNERKRMRSGVTSFSAEDLNSEGVGEIVWSPPLNQMRGEDAYNVWLSLQTSVDDMSAITAPAQIASLAGQQTEFSFKFCVMSGIDFGASGEEDDSEPYPQSGTFKVHWLLVEKFFSDEDQTNLDNDTSGARDDGGHGPGPGGAIGVETADMLADDAVDAILLETGDQVLFEGKGATQPTPADFFLLENGDQLVMEQTLPANQTHKLGIN